MFVYDAAQRGEQSRCAMYLVENEQMVGVFSAVLLDIGDLGQIAGALEVQVKDIALVGDFAGEGRLADLTRPDQDNRRVSVQQFVQGWLNVANYHLCKCNSMCCICIVTAENLRQFASQPSYAPKRGAA